jgi:hypothetical protein
MRWMPRSAAWSCAEYDAIAGAAIDEMGDVVVVMAVDGDGDGDERWENW